MTIRIRPFQEKDAKKVSYLIKKALRAADVYPSDVVEAIGRHLSPGRLIEKSKCRKYYVASDEERIYGIAGLLGDEIRTVFVNPLHQKKGIGRMLIEHIERHAMSKGIPKLWMNASLYAISFYGRLGYAKKRKETHLVDGLKYDVIVMEKKLPHKKNV